jgi:hypothetical protein
MLCYDLILCCFGLFGLVILLRLIELLSFLALWQSGCEEIPGILSKIYPFLFIIYDFGNFKYYV